MYWYILDDDDVPVRAKDLNEHIEWVDKNPHKKIVKQEWIDDVYISTVFLSLDHSLNDRILWKTMVFDNGESVFMERYKSLKEAKEGHEQTVNRIKKEKNEKTEQNGDVND